MFRLIPFLFRRRPARTPSGRPLRESAAPKLGLALSSGGARGLAHVGVLQVLEENDIEIDAIAGTSMGAYVGALWAAGFSGTELEELAAELHDRRQLWKLADPIVPPMKGLFHGLKAKAHLARSLGDLRFEDLERRLLVVAADIDTKERLVLRSGSLVDAVHASCAMPGVIAPVRLGQHRCVDGGVVEPVPVGALQKYGGVDRILAVSVVPTFSDIESGWANVGDEPVHPPLWRRATRALNRNLNLLAPGNVIDTFRQSIRAAQIRMAHDSIHRADLCLRPEHFFATWHDYSHFRKFIDAGREVATRHLEEIRALTQTHETHPSPQVVGDRVA
ncbi:NTE family protein [Haloferula luteola]|uniref:NTE family protein n=1 Tax=Haloferula luteola TaxID=595692 RepID=A0A840UY11_9BACT|nr:patatin-like phospholipase family protein [Haloferula luteola]MBB5351037.1 NTE family protein [Haloferula luteola]